MLFALLLPRGIWGEAGRWLGWLLMPMGYRLKFRALNLSSEGHPAEHASMMLIVLYMGMRTIGLTTLPLSESLMASLI